MLVGMRALWLASLALAALSCAPSEEDIKHDFNEFVSKHQACTQDSECTLIHPGCPLGCVTPIATNAATAGEHLAKELIDDYESLGRSCEYDCLALCGAACDAGRCVVVEPSPDMPGVCPR